MEMRKKKTEQDAATSARVLFFSFFFCLFIVRFARQTAKRTHWTACIARNKK